MINFCPIRLSAIRAFAIRACSIRDSVFGLTAKDCTPFLLLVFAILSGATLHAADSPIAVESRSSSSAAGTNVRGASADLLPFQAPIEENSAEATGIESQYQLQLLQQEVMELRGQVENLTFQLQRMRSTQEDRYLELDKRFQSLQTNPVSTTSIETNSESIDAIPVDQAPVAAVGQDEKTRYETSLELIRNRQYDLAITQLQALISQYPDGDYTANSYYWLGEVYAAKPEPDYEGAREALAQVITFFPEHRKVPDAAFKLGKVYNLMGDCGRATNILTQVIETQKGTSVAKLAESYLRENVNCEQQ
jgi:tol-pal system protein YbgF